MGWGGRSVRNKRECALVVGTTGVTSAHGGRAALAYATRKRSAPLNGIWTATQVTQKLGYLPQSAWVQRTSAGTGTSVCTFSGPGEQRGRGERHRTGVIPKTKTWHHKKTLPRRTFGVETKRDSSKTNSPFTLHWEADCLMRTVRRGLAIVQ